MLQGRFLLEMKIYQVGKSSKYKDGIKYGLILVDTKTGKRVLMDNHHPKGPHIHLDQKEISYEYVSDDKLIQDFKILVFQHMGVQLWNT